MDSETYEMWAATAILYVAKGICVVEFPTTNAGAPSKTVRVVRNAKEYRGIQPLVPVVFHGDLWDLIVRDLPQLQVTPYTAMERDLLPVAVDILRRAVEEWGNPEVEESPENPAGRRTPGWVAEFDPFDP